MFFIEMGSCGWFDLFILVGESNQKKKESEKVNNARRKEKKTRSECALHRNHCTPSFNKLQWWGVF